MYEPEADTFLFLDALDMEVPRLTHSPSAILEVGPGSGVVITHLAVALRGRFGPDHSVVATAVDINPLALAATRETWQSTFATTCDRPSLDLVHGNLMSWCFRKPAFPTGVFDIVLFNPPYVPTTSEELSVAQRGGESGSDWLPAAWAGGPQGVVLAQQFIMMLPFMLNGRDAVGYMVVFGPNDLNWIEDIAKHNRLNHSVVCERFTGEALSIVKFTLMND